MGVISNACSFVLLNALSILKQVVAYVASKIFPEDKNTGVTIH